MNREILFRGKRVDNGEWVEGDLIHTVVNFNPSIQILHWKGNSDNEHSSEVITSTIGQFTGLTNKNGVKIFEGDLLHSAGYLCKVFFDKGCFRTKYDHPEDGETLILGEDLDPMGYEVIGNIHDTIK